MTEQSIDDLWRVLEEVDRMPYGVGHIAAVEQLVRRADAAADAHLRFAARMRATQAYIYGGEPAKSFVTFSWCLADFDRNPGPYHENYTRPLFWHFKNVIHALLRFPEVPLDRIGSVLDDMERRYRAAGHSLQPGYKYRHLVARHIGDAAATEEWYRRWVTAPRGDLSDCAGCDPSGQASHLAATGRDEEAIALAEPVLAGHLTCIEQPQGILCTLLLPYLRTGRHDAAVGAHRQAYRLIRAKPADLADIGDHLEFCALTGNDLRGLEMLERHLPWLDRAPSPAAAMDFATAGALVLRRLADGSDGLTVHRPAHGDRPAADVGVAELAAELAELASGLAARFDARNGTSHQGDRVARQLAGEPLVDHLPLSATVRRPVARRTGGRAPAPAASGTAAAAPVGSGRPEAEIPTGISPEALLDLADEWARTGHETAVAAAVAVFPERFGADALSAPTAARWAARRGAELAATDDLDGAQAALQEAVDRYRQLGDPTGENVAVSRLGLVRTMQGDPEAGMAMLATAIDGLAETGSEYQRATAQLRLVSALRVQERWQDALDALDPALLTAAGDAHLSADAALLRAHCLQMLDRLEEARTCAAQARDGYRGLGAVARLAQAAGLLAECCVDPADAVAAYDEAVQVTSGAETVPVRVGRARALRAADRIEESIDDYVEAVALCAEHGFDEGGAYLRLELADAYRVAGQWLAAAEAAEEALPLLDRLDAPVESIQCRGLLADAYRALGEPAAALTVLDQLVERLDGDDDLPHLAHVHEDAAQVLYRRDDDAAAALRFTTAAEAYRRADRPVDELRSLRQAVAAWSWAGELDTALATVEHADRVAATLPAEPGATWERAMLGYEVGQALERADRLPEALARCAEAPGLFRSVEAVGEALHADLLHGRILLELDRAPEAEPVLRSVLTGLPRRASAVDHAAWLLSRALEALGRDAEAAAIRTEYELDED